MQPRARDEAGNVWEVDAQGNATRLVQPAGPSGGGRVFSLPPNPREVAREQRAAEAADRAAEAAARAATTAERGEDRNRRTDARQSRNDSFSQTNGLAQNYNSDPTVKAYRVAIQQLAQALNTGEGPQADLALTYAFAKALDPESVVRESEQGMVTASQPWFQAAVERVKKEFGMDGAGSFTPQARDALRAQILNSVAQRRTVYDARRSYFAQQAEAFGVDPQLVIGQHDAQPFEADLEAFNRRQAEREAAATGTPAANGEPTAYFDEASGEWIAAPNGRPEAADDFGSSYAGQGVSGINEGLATLLGLPVDAVTGVLNLGVGGINALTGSELPTIENPVFGSEWLRQGASDLNMIAPATDDPTKQFIRRTGQSVGASIIPLGTPVTAARMAGQMAVGAAGGMGAATAQQLAPGNIWAEMGGELLGGAGGGLAAARIGQRGAQRAIEANIPTTQELRQQAGEMYRSAESRGATAAPEQTQSLAAILRQTLADEGRVSPSGHVSEVYPKAREAIRLADDYAGQPMTPTQLQTVRQVITDTGASADATERRLGRLLTEAFDDWAAPIAPELPAAREVASRYLNAETLQEARELAGARAGQFTGSGFENALRTEYRALDRNAIRGRDHFPPEVRTAIENVSRGTPGSNIARAAGRFAARGPMSAGLGIGAPAAIGATLGGTPGAIALGLTAGGIGEIGRATATRMGIRNADIAEMTARNGAPIPQAPFLSPEMQALAARMAAAQSFKYLPQNREQQPR